MEHTSVVTAGEDVGRMIAHLRRRHGLTQAALAERIGIRRSEIAKIEVGRTTPLVEHELTALRRLGARVVITWNDERPSGG